MNSLNVAKEPEDSGLFYFRKLLDKYGGQKGVEVYNTMINCAVIFVLDKEKEKQIHDYIDSLGSLEINTFSFYVKCIGRKNA